MILAIDVSYRKKEAIVAGILFSDWCDEKPQQQFVISCTVPDNYLPGQFFRRELPCIAALLEHIKEPVDFILIDGFVYLGKEKKPGLGKHLRDMLDERVTVIGVAKTSYRDTPTSTEILRGKSLKPLYVTADGISGTRAKTLIKNMHGRDRIPSLLKYVDRLCRESAL